MGRAPETGGRPPEVVAGTPGVQQGAPLRGNPIWTSTPEILDMYPEKVNVKNTVSASPAPNVDLTFLGPLALGPWAPEAAGRRPTLGPRALG